MRHITIWIFIVILLLCPTLVHAMDMKFLIKGQSTTITTDYSIGDVAITDPNTCDFLVGQDRSSVYISARSGGETTLTIWDKDGQKRNEYLIKVATTTLKEALDRAKSEFGDLTNLDVNIRNGHVEINGEVTEPEDMKRLDGITERDPRVINRAKLSREVLGTIKDAIEKEIDIPGVTVRSVKDKVVLEGVAYSAVDARRAIEIAKIFSPNVLDLIETKETKRQVGRGKLIELDIHMMEIKKSALRELGINWAPGVATQGSSGADGGIIGSAGGIVKDIFGFIFNLLPKIRFLRERGDGRILENHKVIVKSGEDTKIARTTELPYYKGGELEFKKTGVEIDATPIETKNGIDLKITANVSAPSSDIRGAVDTKTISTTTICPVGQSIVIGNIIHNQETKTKNKKPSDMDTSSSLFTLFLSKDFQSNRSEFVIFITPHIVDTPDAADLKLREYLANEEATILGRSRREFREFVSKRDPAIPINTKQHIKRRAKW